MSRGQRLSGVFPYMERRLNVLWDAVRQVTYRLAMLTLWTPYLLPLAAIAILDGLTRRRVKLAEFGNSSPSVHRYSLYTILTLLYLLLLGLLLPLPLSPVAAPLALGMLIIFIPTFRIPIMILDNFVPPPYP